LPDSASVQRTQEVMAQLQRIALGSDNPRYKGPAAPSGEKTYSGIPGINHTVSIAGQSFLLNANGSNFGSCFVILAPLTSAAHTSSTTR
jgi:multidrug efflux pump